MTEIMVDLETFGVDPDCVVVAIGAVAFGRHADPGIHGPTYYAVLNTAGQQERGRKFRSDTVSWWLHQDTAARLAIANPTHATYDALREFTDFILQFDKPTIWGNGAAFDNVILKSLFKSYGLEAPWSHRQDRCYRTFVAEASFKDDLTRHGTYHNALDDALHQMRVMQTITRNRA